jgi:hypothetical protein
MRKPFPPSPPSLPPIPHPGTDFGSAARPGAGRRQARPGGGCGRPFFAGAQPGGVLLQGAAPARAAGVQRLHRGSGAGWGAAWGRVSGRAAGWDQGGVQ